jgi:hypothetical protein
MVELSLTAHDYCDDIADALHFVNQLLNAMLHSDIGY